MPRIPSRFAPHPRITHHEAEIPGLDSRHDGLRIAHLTDVHVGRLTPPSHVRAAVDLANQAEADLIVLTGDYVCWSRSEVEPMREQLGGLRARQVVVTLGNHDYFTAPRPIAQAMRDNGYDVLHNQHTTLEVGGAPLHVVGIDDPVTGQDDVERAFRGLERTGTTVALAHCPEVADRVAQRGADLIFSGHTHGGQIWLQGVSDKIFYGRMRRRYRVGMYDLGGAQLYVGSGVGFSGVRARVGQGTRSEVAVVTLRRAAGTDRTAGVSSATG